MKRSHLIHTFITRPHGLHILSNSPSDQSGPLWAVCGRLYGSVYVKIRLGLKRSRCDTTHPGFNTARLGHRLPTGTALSHAHGTTFITLAAVYRAATPTIPTKINTTTLDIRLVARLGVRRCKRDAHDSHCARNACGYSSSLYWLLDTRGRDDPDTHSLSLPTSGSLHVRLPSMATAWSAGGQDIAWVALPSDRLARQRRGPSWSALPGDPASLARNTTLLIP
jgi:hypothetical protein